MSITRRHFLSGTAAAVVVAGMKSSGKVWGANDRIQIAHIGINGQGNRHRQNLLKLSDQADIAALCDVDEAVLAKRIGETKAESGKEPKGYRDMRDLFADDSIDAVTIATPNHWHTLAAIWACQAGKDAYVEKPLSHSIYEGRQLIAAAAKYGRVVTHGTQQRTRRNMLRDIKLMHAGFIGDIVHARGVVYKNGGRDAIGKGTAAAPPAGLDYALWQGPAPESPYLKTEGGDGLFVPYNWHWFWHWGNGEIGNQGVHEVDVAVWAINKGMPKTISSVGGRYGWDDDGETPNTQTTQYTYDDGTIMTFEVRNLGSLWEGGKDNCSNSVYGTEGYWIRDIGFFSYDESKRDTPLSIPSDVEGHDLPVDGGEGHRFADFLQAVRSRKPEDNRAPATAGHESCVHIHTANIAYRLGRTLTFDGAAETFVGDDEANTYLKRTYRPGFEVPALA